MAPDRGVRDERDRNRSGRRGVLEKIADPNAEYLRDGLAGGRRQYVLPFNVSVELSWRPRLRCLARCYSLSKIEHLPKSGVVFARRIVQLKFVAEPRIVRAEDLTEPVEHET